MRFIPLFGADRIVYENRSLEGPISVHILYIDPQVVSITAVRAHDKFLGRETVSAMAQKKSALAGINGGFFRMGGPFDGEPVGVLKICDDWYSDSPLPRGVIGWNLKEKLLQWSGPQ